MGKKRKQLSQAEVWDDSALLQSWDGALAEYKLYHSIHVRGERVEDMIKDAGAGEEDAHMIEDSLRQAAAGMRTNGISPEELDDKEARAEDRGAHMTGKNLRQAAAGMHTNDISSEGLEDGELEEETEIYANGDSMENSHEPSAIESEQKERLARGSTAVDEQEKPGMPSAVINGVKDEALKNIMMSWYYAGYYTGLYEGQQQQQNTPSG